MTASVKFALLRDLASLAKKYGSRTFSDLAAFLSDPENIAELVMILRVVESTSRKPSIVRTRAASTRRRGDQSSIPRLLSSLAKQEPQKAEILASFYEALETKRVLQTLRELRSFALDNDLKVVSATSRDKAVLPLVRDLAVRSIEEIRSIVARLSVASTTLGDRSLEKWTDIILSKQRS